MIDYIRSLKVETIEGLVSRVEINKEHNYKFRIVSRGDQLFHQDGDRALLIQMNPYDYAIYTKSINNWDDGEKITDQEKELIISRVKDYFKNFQDSDVKIA